ncbi:MAG: hypothetical protein H7832_06845 [Magnetococcus sp. DMHC-6]
MTEQENPISLPLDKKTIDMLLANFVPTTKYLEVRFDHLQHDILHVRTELNEFKKDTKYQFEQLDKHIDGLRTDTKENFNKSRLDINTRFEQVDNRFEQIDKRIDDLRTDTKENFNKNRLDINTRFEQVDKRFEQVDKRFEQVDKRFEEMHVEIKEVGNKLDKLLERIDVKIDAGLRENRMLTIRLFTFAILFSAISITGMLGKMFKLF